MILAFSDEELADLRAEYPHLTVQRESAATVNISVENPEGMKVWIRATAVWRREVGGDKEVVASSSVTRGFQANSLRSVVRSFCDEARADIEAVNQKIADMQLRVRGTDARIRLMKGTTE